MELIWVSVMLQRIFPFLRSHIIFPLTVLFCLDYIVDLQVSSGQLPQGINNVDGSVTIIDQQHVKQL